MTGGRERASRLRRHSGRKASRPRRLRSNVTGLDRAGCPVLPGQETVREIRARRFDGERDAGHWVLALPRIPYSVVRNCRLSTSDADNRAATAPVVVSPITAHARATRWPTRASATALTIASRIPSSLGSACGSRASSNVRPAAEFVTWKGHTWRNEGAKRANHVSRRAGERRIALGNGRTREELRRFAAHAHDVGPSGSEHDRRIVPAHPDLLESGVSHAAALAAHAEVGVRDDASLVLEGRSARRHPRETADVDRRESCFSRILLLSCVRPVHCQQDRGGNPCPSQEDSP